MNDLEKHAMELLKVDTLAQANEDVGVAIALQQVLNQNKEDAFSVLGDTYSGILYADVVRGIERAGYRKVFSENFGDGEVFEAWWHDEGVLVTTESYEKTRTNRVQGYYNWAPLNGDIDLAYRIAESGGFVRNIERRVWCGHVDGRAGLHTHLKRLRENGEFLSQWVETPFLWLVNYGEEHQGRIHNEYDEINAKKLATFPVEVRQAICATKESR